MANAGEKTAADEVRLRHTHRPARGPSNTIAPVRVVRFRSVPFFFFHLRLARARAHRPFPPDDTHQPMFAAKVVAIETAAAVAVAEAAVAGAAAAAAEASFALSPTASLI